MITTHLDILRKTSLTLKTYDENLARMLRAELVKHETGVGLSAIQLGIPARMCVVEVTEVDKYQTTTHYLTLWNPIILSKSNMAP